MADGVAALIDLRVDRPTLDRLYALGLICAEDQVEALARLSLIARAGRITAGTKAPRKAAKAPPSAEAPDRKDRLK